MKRLIDILGNWKHDPRRKSLIVIGARQVGETYAVRGLGQCFESVVEVYFELLADAKNIFEKI